MGLAGRARAAGISNFASRVEPRADDASPRWSIQSCRVERAGHEEDSESRQDEGESGSVSPPAHATSHHAAPPSEFAEMNRSPLPHLLFTLSAAHPLLAPLPAHLSALLPSPRRAFHRVAGARVASFPISSFPSRVEAEESTVVESWNIAI